MRKDTKKGGGREAVNARGGLHRSGCCLKRADLKNQKNLFLFIFLIFFFIKCLGSIFLSIFRIGHQVLAICHQFFGSRVRVGDDKSREKWKCDWFNTHLKTRRRREGCITFFQPPKVESRESKLFFSLFPKSSERRVEGPETETESQPSLLHYHFDPAFLL